MPRSCQHFTIVLAPPLNNNDNIKAGQRNNTTIIAHRFHAFTLNDLQQLDL